MGDGDRFRMELEVSGLWPAHRQLWIDGRRGLRPEWQTSPAAFRVTEQPCSGFALLTSHEVVQTLPTPLFPDMTPHSSGISICSRHQHRTIKCTYRFATCNVRTLLDTDASDRPARHTALVAAELHESYKDHFYDNLRSTLWTVSPRDKIALLGDFNARVGSNHHIWNGIIGKHVLWIQTPLTDPPAALRWLQQSYIDTTSTLLLFTVVVMH